MIKVYNRHGELRRECETVKEAAAEILSYDENEWEIREGRLYVSQFSRNSSCFNGLHPSRFWGTDEEIFSAVVRAANSFDNQSTES